MSKFTRLYRHREDRHFSMEPPANTERRPRVVIMKRTTPIRTREITPRFKKRPCARVFIVEKLSY